MAEIKLPRSLAAAADRLYKIKDELKPKAQRVVDALDDERKALEKMLIEGQPDGQTGVQGKVAKVGLLFEDVPTVKDWDKVRKYIVKTGAWDLLQKRLSTKAWADRVEAGEKIPGTESFTRVSVSCTKI